MKKYLKRLCSCLLILSLSLSLSLTAHAYPTDYPNTHTNTGDQRADVVEVAKTQVGYTEDDSGTKYGAWWGSRLGSSYNYTTAAWCAMFVLWCENEANAANAVNGMSASSSALLRYYQNGKNGNTAYSFASGYTPRPGDIIFVGYTSDTTYTDHVGLVVGVDSEYIYTIEGNSSNKVSEVKYKTSTGIRSYSSTRKIVYFGVPAYENDSDPNFKDPEEQEPVTAIGTPVEPYETTVTGTTLNIRIAPDGDAKVIRSLLQGAKVTIIAEYKGSSHLWGLVEDQTGWICLYYTTNGDTEHPAKGEEPQPEEPENPDPSDPDDPDEPDEPDEPDTPEVPDTPTVLLEGYVSCNLLNVRETPSTEATILRTLEKNTVVRIVEKKTSGGINWGRLEDGGWVSLQYVTEGTPPAAEITEGVKGTVTASALNVRETPVSGKVVKTLPKGTVVTITEIKPVNGVNWGKITDGWICMTYVKLEEQTEAPTETTYYITAEEVNVRSGAGTSYAIVKVLNTGDEIKVTEIKTVDGSRWGQIPGTGWVSMTYTSETKPGTGTEEPGPDDQITFGSIECTGTILPSTLNVRNEPGGDTIVTTLRKGRMVTILETTTVDDVEWGRIEQGWICLEYVLTLRPQTQMTITGDVVRVRSGAGTGYAVITKVKNGETVMIDQTSTDNNGLEWGHIVDSGWICLKYAE